MTGTGHPALGILSQRAAEAGLDIDAINADVQSRAVVTLLLDVLDMATGPVVAHPRLLPIASLTLQSYAELLDRSEVIIADSPQFRAMVAECERADREAHYRQNGGPDHE